MRMRRRVGNDEPSYTLYRQILTSVVDIMRPAVWEIPEDFLERSHFDRVIKGVDMNSTPGFPYCRTYSTNRILFRADVETGECDPLRLDMVWEWVQRALRERTFDPVRLFVKPEPHKISKIETSRYRLISAVSIVDHIIDAMLFSPFNDKVVEQHQFTPVKVGWNPYNGGWKNFPQGWCATDKSQWDWTVMAWLLQLELEIRERLCSNLTEQWIDLARWRYQCLFRDCVFITSDGLKLKQLDLGIMKSGCVNTIISNSLMQLILHVRACIVTDQPLSDLWVVGDDVYQQLLVRMDEYLAELSRHCILKQCIVSPEFVGHKFYGMRVEPAYRGKHAFNLLHMKEDLLPDYARAYSLLYHRSSRGDHIKRIFKYLGQDVPSEEALDYIFDGEE